MVVALAAAAPADASTRTYNFRVGPVDLNGYATEQALERRAARRGAAAS